MEKTKSLEFAKNICVLFDEKKGEDIRLIDVSNVTTITDYFIIVTGNSDTQITALVRAVEETADKNDVRYKVEGSGGWILLDCGDVVVHIFDEKNRMFYMLERLWADGKEVAWAD